MNLALFCWRPYQVFNSINIVQNNVEGSKGNTTLFVYDYPILEKLNRALRDTGIFKDVVILHNHQESGDHFKKFYGQLFPGRSLANADPEHRDFRNKFDVIMATSFNLNMLEMVSINPDAKIAIYEDGVNSYGSDDMFKHLNPKLRLFRRLIGRDLYKTQVGEKYFYSPELIAFKTESVISKLPDISNEVADIQRYVFNYNSSIALSTYKNKNIIYLDQDIKSDNYDSFYAVLLNYTNKVIFRPHPNVPPTSSDFDLDESELSWELLCNDIIGDNTVLISPTSMALFTPYMIYHKRPTIIVLYKLLLNENAYGIHDFALFCTEFKRKCGYVNMYIPETIDEFDRILKRLN